MKQEIKGFDNLTGFERFLINRIIQKNLGKVKKYVGEPSRFRFFVKSYSNEGKNKRTSIHLEIKLNNRNFEADAQGWNSSKVTKSIFEKLLNQIEHEFHTSDIKNAQKKSRKQQKPKDLRDLGY
ncbi:MAG: hypothetical protein ACOCUU_00910 [Nanoarchaeota archaeon]